MYVTCLILFELFILPPEIPAPATLLLGWAAEPLPDPTQSNKLQTGNEDMTQRFGAFG
jgi:hypothetical protein